MPKQNTTSTPKVDPLAEHATFLAGAVTTDRAERIAYTKSLFAMKEKLDKPMAKLSAKFQPFADQMAAYDARIDELFGEKTETEPTE